MRKPAHRIQAAIRLEEAENLFKNDEYIKIRGYKEIELILKMADIHERLSR